MNLQNAIVVFVARAEPARLMTQHAKRDWLLKSLEPVKEFRETILPGLVETFVFILQSNSPFRPAGEVILYFTDLFKEAQQQDRDILLVVRGWDGLTTNQGAFQKLFALRPESVLGLLVCPIWAGGLDPEDPKEHPNTKLNWPTKSHLEWGPAITASKYRLSNDFKLLRDFTFERNTHRWAKGPIHEWGFEGCGAACYLEIHRSRTHGVLETEEAKQADSESKKCRYCGKTYARKYSRDRHEKTCLDNPDHETRPKGQPFAISKRRETTDPQSVPMIHAGVKKVWLVRRPWI
ncbi:uncharacterized protein N7473_012007 [Penicillium subrubescens]|uniref:uncharacterized protein n=1 Tax=Penicillium subrubescens TaxID=1316194 RepID=UPI002545AF34|nr:uncharacterized protein N7473_012007 [Penicillium subrubescens]KAJ5880954.1 hypothetical protein N7473_012007 [Penicillium subrubescens]